MPHMMPMLWLFIFLSSMLFLFILSTMIYFFYMPNIIMKHTKKNTLHHNKWNWMW